MSRWAMNCTIWRTTSTSAPFSASSASAIVALVIVNSFGSKVDGSHLNLIRTHDGHPDIGPAAAARQAATGYALRAQPSAPCRAPVDLHHFPGHQPQLPPAPSGRGRAGVVPHLLPACGRLQPPPQQPTSAAPRIL